MPGKVGFDNLRSTGSNFKIWLDRVQSAPLNYSQGRYVFGTLHMKLALDYLEVR
jgi:hypothetical protein